jgi:hypothetical protein
VVTVDDGAYVATGLVLEPLNTRAVDWAQPTQESPIPGIVIDPDLVRYVGRVSGIIDASLLSLPGELEGYHPLCGDARRREAVQKRAAAIGPRAFTRRTALPLRVEERAALGRPISHSNVMKAIRALCLDHGHPLCARHDCDHPSSARVPFVEHAEVTTHAG